MQESRCGRRTRIVDNRIKKKFEAGSVGIGDDLDALRIGKDTLGSVSWKSVEDDMAGCIDIRITELQEVRIGGRVHDRRQRPPTAREDCLRAEAFPKAKKNDDPGLVHRRDAEEWPANKALLVGTSDCV